MVVGKKRALIEDEEEEVNVIWESEVAREKRGRSEGKLFPYFAIQAPTYETLKLQLNPFSTFL